MKLISRFQTLFNQPVFTDKRFLLFLWILMGVIGGLKGTKIHNNYFIFKGVFYHTLEQINLYIPYPAEYRDVNHYGPLFSLIIAPFAMLPDRLGVVLWDVAMGVCLFVAIYYLPIAWKNKCLLYYVLLIGLYTCVMNSQTNALIASLLIGSLLTIRKEKDIWAACFIMFGTFIKLYGIVGLAFFPFSKHKKKFIAYLGLWSIVFFVAPMLISSPSFILQSYGDWYTELTYKNVKNITSFSQDMSAIGLIRRTTGWLDISALWIIVPGSFLFLLQYIHKSYYSNLKFQLGILASTLLFVILFSTGTESETYIIALTGVGVWYTLQSGATKKWSLYLLLFTVFWTWFTTFHLIPREIFYRYSLKVIPSLCVWLILVYQMIRFPKSLKEEDIHYE